MAVISPSDPRRGEVVIGVAELRVDHRRPLEQVTDLELHGHADAAVELDRLLADEAPGAADLNLRGRGGLATSCAFSCDHGGEHRHAARLFEGHEHLAARCCSAWKDPIVVPNCLRVFR